MFTFEDKFGLLVWSACTTVAFITFIKIGSGSRFSVAQWLKKRKIENWIRKNRTSINFAVENLLEFDTESGTKKIQRYQFIGCESDGTCLLIDFTATHANKEAYLYLKLADGRIFTLPKIGRGDVSLENLRFEVLVPHSKWRITYNGSLCLHPPHSTEECRHVIFTFFWNAASDPVAWPNNWSIENVARSLDHSSSDFEDTLDNWLNAWRGFDQCGAMYGQVTIEREYSVDNTTKEIIEINLPGVRRSRFGEDIDTYTDSCSRENTTLFGAGNDGCIFSLSAGSEVCFGFVRWPNGDIMPVERSNIVDMLFNASNLSSAININFATASKEFSLSLSCHEDSSTRLLGFQNKSQTEISVMTTDLNGFKCNGLIVSQKPMPQTNLLTPSDQAVYPSFISSKSCDKTQLAIPFDCDECQNKELCGGKGSSLGFLTFLSHESTHEFVVPDGFVLSTAAFNLQLNRYPRLNFALMSLENIAHQRSGGSLRDACTELSDLLKSTYIHSDIIVAVTTGLALMTDRANADALKLAIRSSAVGEDGSDSSSAGQNETYLAVVDDIEHVVNAIRNCWASLFSYQSVVYRLQNIQPIRTAMAVVIQSMVASESAGVLFTHFPVNNDPNKLFITANFGLGESVVSGKVDPDEFVVRRDLHGDRLSILERKIGGKELRMEMNRNGETTVRYSMYYNKYCLNDEQILQLSRIGVYLERCYRSPRDIEWAIYDTKIYLLQSRPMTSTTTFSKWELLHEFDTAIMSRSELCTFANVGEVMPETMSPLTITTLIPSMSRTTKEQISPEVKASPLYITFNTISHWRVAIDILNVFLYHVEPEITLRTKVLGMTVFGHEFVDDDMHKLAVHRNGLRPTSVQMIWDLIKAVWNNKNVVRKCKQFVNEFRGTYDASNMVKFTDLPALFDDLTEKLNDMDYLGRVHGNTSKITSLYQMIVFQTLAEGNTDLTNEITSDVALILGSCKDVESAEIPVLLEEIVNSIIRSGKQKVFNAIFAFNGVEWLKRNCPEAFDLLHHFLERHGHRAYAEFDFASTTWNMDPAQVIEMLQSSIKTGSKHKKAKTPMEDSEIIAALKSPKRQTTRSILKFILPHFKTSVRLRESSKSCHVAYIHELRKGIIYLARKMVQTGLLSHPDLIFFLTHHELGLVLNEHRIEFVLKAQRRRRANFEFRKLRFEEIQRGVPKPMSNTISIDSTAIQAKGTPVCGGNVNARACVVHHFSEVSKIQAGDILITCSTDIAWSPYFPILAGVVTELGGLVSHGAVVAREYGLPCIVGATNATAIINDGDYINMDAYTGIITKFASGEANQNR